MTYSGTHDNDTAFGFVSGMTESAFSDFRRRLRAALRGEGVSYPFVTRRDSVRALIRCALATRSDICIIPVQDILGLDNSSRMNVPGTPSGNWQFRLAEIPGRQQAAIFRAAVRASGRL